jgi:enamine deaminase RidA (YjgF/YER057c/UK114 family)
MLISRHDPEAAPPVGRYSQVVRVELGEAALLFVSGLVAVDAQGQVVGSGDAGAQLDQVYTNLQAVLASQGAGLEHVVRMTTYLKQGVDVTVFRERSRMSDDALPAATAVFVHSLVDPDYLMEVEVTAVVPASGP